MFLDVRLVIDISINIFLGFLFLFIFVVFSVLLRSLLLVNLNRCMRYWGNLSVTQLLVRRMEHLKKTDWQSSLCWLTISKSEDCAKRVRV